MANLLGQTLGRYHILEQLGEGGMAVVYKAYDTRLETDVAVKVIRTENIAPVILEQSLKRFEREAKALARLTHPNIVKVTDFGDHKGKPYLVMEYLQGGTLKERLKSGAIPWQDAVQLLLPVAHALEYAHKNNIIHRDVKPSNILLTESGQPMLTDFGVAKLFDMADTQGLTGTGMAIGTPDYMAPEQWTGDFSVQTDIYALGVVLYEIVTGRRPYMADTPAALFLKQSNDPLPMPRKFVDGLPEGVEKVLFKALAKKAEDRYSSMLDFANSLAGLLSHIPETPSPPPPPVTTTTADRESDAAISTRNEPNPSATPRYSIWLMGGLGLVLVLIAATINLLPRRNTPAPYTETPTRTTTPAHTATMQSSAPSTHTRTFTPQPTFTRTLTPRPTNTPIPPTKTQGTSYAIMNPSSPMRLWVMSIENCTVNVNGILVNEAGPWKWDWGDGFTQRGWFPQKHTYSGSGSYVITVSASSDIGNSILLNLFCK